MVALYFSLLMFSGAVSCFSAAPAIEVRPDTTDELSQALPSLLLPARPKSEVFLKAESVILALRAEPSCQQVATRDLIDSCHGLGQSGGLGKNARLEKMLDATKNEYAVKLALCEWSAPDSSIPKVCTPFMPTKEACTKRRGWWHQASGSSRKQHDSDEVCYPQFNQKDVDFCLSELRKTPQSWTSYSNARQNAVVVCQASREAIEKDRLIALYKTMVETAGGLAAASDEAIKRQEDAAVAHHESLAQLKTAVSDNLHDIKSQLGSAVGQLYATVETNIARIHGLFGELDKSIEVWDERVAENLSNADKLNAAFVSFIGEISRNSDLVVTQQQQQMDSVNTRVAYMMALIRNMTTHEVASLQAGFGQMLDAMNSTLKRGDQVQLMMDMLVQKTEHHNKLLEVTGKKIKQFSDILTRLSNIPFWVVFYIPVLFHCLSRSKQALGDPITCCFAFGLAISLGVVKWLFELLDQLLLPSWLRLPGHITRHPASVAIAILVASGAAVLAIYRFRRIKKQAAHSLPLSK